MKKLKSSLPKDAFYLVLVEIGPVVLKKKKMKKEKKKKKKKILNFVNVFSLFRNHLPVEKGGALHLNNLTYPFTQG